MDTQGLSLQLKKHFGFDSFLQGQEDVISRILAGQSTMAIFPTGSGKSLCYQFPALFLSGLTLVVSPLIALMDDQLSFLKTKGLSAAKIDSTLSRDEYSQIIQDARSGELKILMISVERFKNERFRNILRSLKISLLVIDEAHCISEWGHNFRPEYLKLPNYQTEFSIPLVLALTATATKEVVQDMSEKLNICKKDIISTGFYRSNLFLQVTSVESIQKISSLINRLSSDPDLSTIVYVTLQKTADYVSKRLNEAGLRSLAYHAGKGKEERTAIQEEFMSGKTPVIVATIAFGMGIDKHDIRRVIHYDLPKSLENYAQEIGRAGRDGKYAFCEVFACKDNINILENFVYGDSFEPSSIAALLSEISQDEIFELQLNSLSNQLDIKPLPLKTLFVYLELEGILISQNSYFEDYSFKYLRPVSEIIDSFEGERQSFVRLLTEHCHTKKTWTYVDMETLSSLSSDRNRIISALEYFSTKNWIELSSKKMIEVYRVKKRDFDSVILSEKMSRLFHHKEEQEIKRIQRMIRFFEGEGCLSRELAAHFDYGSEVSSCGHCSGCLSGPVQFASALELPAIASLSLDQKIEAFLSVYKVPSPLNLTKFLCGLTTPSFRGLKIKSVPGFALLEDYPFRDVYDWVKLNLKNNLG